MTLGIWKVTQGVGKTPLSVACYSFQLVLWPVSESEEPNKQRGIDGQSGGGQQQQGRADGPTVFKESA